MCGWTFKLKTDNNRCLKINRELRVILCLRTSFDGCVDTPFLFETIPVSTFLSVLTNSKCCLRVPIKARLVLGNKGWG